MTKFKCMTAIASLLTAGAACADGFKGNVGVASDYLFRGIEGSAGAAVQGELYYAWDKGFYAGGWISNTRAASNQLDVYGGYATKLGDFNVGGGAVYRYFSEEKESNTFRTPSDRISYAELFVTGGLGPVALTAYYTNDYFGTQADGIYVTGDVTLALNETVSAIAEVGFNSGGGVKKMWGDSYVDYSATLEKKLDNGFSASFAVAGTDRDVNVGAFSVKDQPKFMVGLKKEFNL